MTTVPEPDLGPPPQQESEIRPPEQYELVDLTTDDQPQQVASEPPGDTAEPETEEVTELTDEERLLFRQLLTVGQRSKTITVMDHPVTIQSLRVADDLRIGMYVRPYEGTKIEHRAFQLGVCAAGIRTIDGTALYEPLGAATDDDIFDNKIEKLKNYYPVVLTQIYREILALDQEFAELAMKLGKLNG